MDPRATALIHFWFGGTHDLAGMQGEHSRMSMWWGGDEATDKACEQFLQLHIEASQGKLDEWRQSPAEMTALVLLLDQIPRNVFRGSPHAFATDHQARALTHDAIERGLDEEAPLCMRYFLYMPLMHSENLSDHEIARQRFGALVDKAKADFPDAVELFTGAVDYEERHARVIERFGRYPHRNEVLGRSSTDEETQYLAEGKTF